MKRLVALLLAFIIIITLSSCKTDDTSSNISIKDSEILCSNCNAKIISTDKFCSECGFAVKDTSMNNSSEIVKENTSNISSEASSSKVSSKVNQKHTHDYGNAVITKKPTCTEQGIKTFYCSSCSGTKAEYIEATGHKWEEATCVSPKKCSVCDATDGEKLEHTYSDNNCTLCGKEKIIFNYSLLSYPIILPGYGGSSSIKELKCYVEDNTINVNFFYTSNGAYSAMFHIRLLNRSNGKVITCSIAFCPYPTGEHEYTQNIVTREGFLKMESGEYYVEIC